MAWGHLHNKEKRYPVLADAEVPVCERLEADGSDQVIIEFRANDSKAQNWQHKAEFKQDYLAPIDTFRKLASSPKIYLCLPTLALARNTFGVQPDVIDKEIVPIVEEVAKESGASLIDLHRLMQGQTGWFLNGLHPNAIGQNPGRSKSRDLRQLIVRKPRDC